MIGFTRYRKDTLTIVQTISAPESDMALYESDEFGCVLGSYPGANWQLQVIDGLVTPVEIPSEPPHLFERRAAAKRLLKDAVDDYGRSIVGKYSGIERDGFAKQEAEARAFLAGQTGAFLCLQGIAATAEKTIEQCAARIVAKADEYANFYGRLVGWRQLKEAEIEAANDPESVALDDFTG